MLKVTRNNTTAKTLSIIFTLFISLLMIGQANADNYDDKQRSLHRKQYISMSLLFDIAENGARFSFDAEPVDENGMPAYGGEFITQGYLYPHGFLDTHEGVLEDGSPAYPDEVIGRWTCRGWHIGEGASTVSGPWVITNQLFDLKKEYGVLTIITEGYELSDINKPIERAITGGTGKFKRAKGASTQKLLGFNASQGVNVRVELRPIRF